MAINLNSNPYFDDFDDKKNFHQILFKPGVAVQARELTQIQSILRDQIEKFGNHVFKHGSVVLPGNSYSDLATPYVKVESSYGGANLNLALYEGQTFVGETSGVEAIVKKAVAEQSPDPVTFYLAYTKGNGNNIYFQNGEEIFNKENYAIRALVKPSAATGSGSMAFVNAGVYYINGSFVYTPAQSIVISKYDSVPSVSVLFKIVEEVINSDEDGTLLDPAQGSYNYAAPGADRVKIELVLTALPIGAPLGADYVELMRYVDGVLEEHARNPKYSELDKSLARRTYDESGNYVVQGLAPTLLEHLKFGLNGGAYADGDSNKFVIDVSPGKAYIEGFEVEKIAKTRLVADKARTPDHIKSLDFSLRPSYGQYIYISNIRGNIGIASHEDITLWTDSDPLSGTAYQLGTAKVLAIDYEAGDQNTLDAVVYRLWVTDLVLDGGATIEMIGGVRGSGGGSAFLLHEFYTPLPSKTYTNGEVVSHSSGRTATVKYWNPTESKLYLYIHDPDYELPKVGDQILGASSTATSVLETKSSIVVEGQSSTIFRLPKDNPYSLKTEGGTYDLSYTTQKELNIVTDGDGIGSVTISTGEIMPIEVGSFLAVHSGGNLSPTLFSLNTNGNTLTINTGPISTTVTVYCNVLKTNVLPKTKTKTLYTQNIGAPDWTMVLDKADVFEIVSVIDDTGDITANYDHWDGQTDYEYRKGRLYRRNGTTAPVGGLVVTYYYYEHSLSGDFFCVDSYSSEVGYLDNVYNYTSGTTGNSIDLKSCLDFRPTVGTGDTMGGVGAKKNDLIVSETVFSSTLRFFVPRYDVLTIDVAGRLNLIRGIPSDEPTIPPAQSNQFVLNSFYIPAYTSNVYDVQMNRLGVTGYKMSDIKNVESRVERLEEFATLTASEMATTNFEVIDAETGLSRFKTGFLVENFTDPFIIGRTNNEQFSSTFVGQTLQAGKEETICDLSFDFTYSTGYEIVGQHLVMPYSEVVFAKQPLSSRTTNLNPFVAISWSGTLDVIPPIDIWTENAYLPTVFETQYRTITVFINPPAPTPDGGNAPALPNQPSTSVGSGTQFGPVPTGGTVNVGSQNNQQPTTPRTFTWAW